MNSPSSIRECYICGQEQDCYYVELFTIGSEGTWLCQTCRLLLTEFARKLHEFRYRAAFARPYPTQEPR